MITFGYALVLAVIFFIPEGVDWAFENGIGKDAYLARDVEDVGVPIYSTVFGVYMLIVSQIAFIFIIYSAIELKKSMGDTKFAKKYIFNIIGILLFDIILFGNIISNTVNDPGLRGAFLIISIVVIPAAFMVYFGLKKEDEE